MRKSLLTLFPLLILACNGTPVAPDAAPSLSKTSGPGALASPPTVETEHWVGQYLNDCGDFQIVDSWFMDVKITYYWNSDGSLDRYHIHGEAVDTLSNPVSGKSLIGRTEGYNFYENVADAPGIWKHAGLMFHVNVPGEGVVLIDAGYMIMYVDGQPTYMKGNHEYNSGDYASLCAYLR